MSLRRSSSCLVLLLLVACPARTRVREPELPSAAPALRPTADPGERGAPARTLTDADAGVQFSLPDGWTARRVVDEGAVLSRAYGPAGSGLVLEVRRWDGDEASLRPLLAADPSSWWGSGPYAAIAAAVGPPIVTTWRAAADERGESAVVFGWFFRTQQGLGVGVTAAVREEHCEAGYLAARDIANSARSVAP